MLEKKSDKKIGKYLKENTKRILICKK